MPYNNCTRVPTFGRGIYTSGDRGATWAIVGGELDNEIVYGDRIGQQLVSQALAGLAMVAQIPRQ